MNKNDISDSNKNHPMASTGETTRKEMGAAKESVMMAAGAAKDSAELIGDAAGHATEATKSAAECCAGKARDLYQTAAHKAEHSMSASKDCMRRNPVLFVLGALTFGAVIGSMLIAARRKPSFAQRYDDEPLTAVREAILGALSPVTQRIHQGYDSAKDGAGKAMGRMQCLGRKPCDSQATGRIARIVHTLKFW